MVVVVQHRVGGYEAGLAHHQHGLPRDLESIEQRSDAEGARYLDLASGMAQQATVLSDYHRLEIAATAMVEGPMEEFAVDVPEWDRDSWECVSEERRAHSERRRTLSVAAAAGAAAIVAFTGVMLWWAAEPPPISPPMVGALQVAGEISIETSPFVNGTIEFMDSGGIEVADIDAGMLSLSPFVEVVPESVSASPKSSGLGRCNTLTFWSACRLAAQCDIQQALFSSTLFMGFVQLDFKAESFTFSRRVNSDDWINPRIPLALMPMTEPQEL